MNEANATKELIGMNEMNERNDMIEVTDLN